MLLASKFRKAIHILKGLLFSSDSGAVNNKVVEEVKVRLGLKRPQLYENIEVLPQPINSGPANVKGGLRGKELPGFAEQFRCGGVASGGVEAHSVTNHESLKLLPYAKACKAGEYFYGGPVFYNFGHFIAESIHRLAPFETIKHRKLIKGVVFQPQRSRLEKKSPTLLLPEHFYEILHYMGVDRKQVILQKKPFRVENLWVSPQESYFRSRERVSEAYLDFLSRCEKQANIYADPSLPERLYVSRTPYLLRGSFAGEKYIESLLRKDGYTIFQPEKYDLITQLKYYKSAKEIVFSEGAAIHVLELLAEVPGCISIIQRRRSTNRMFEPLLTARSPQVSFFSEVYPLPSLFVAKGQTTAATGSALSILDQTKLADYINNCLTKEVFNTNEFASQVVIDVYEYYKTYEEAVERSKASNKILEMFKSTIGTLQKNRLIKDINL